MLNHFNFKKMGNNRILITNDFGQHMFLTGQEFQTFMTGRTERNSPLYEKLHQKLFLLEPMEIFSNEIADDLRSMKNYLFASTSLHIFVVTNICNLHCIYCQAQDKNTYKKGFMSAETAKRAVDIALQSPAKNLTFEFQGGEPLLNFPVIQQIIEYSEMNCGDKEIQYTLVSNLSLLTEEILDYLILHQVNICTSIDGPKELHNQNRICMDSGSSSFEMAQAGINRIKAKAYSFNAIQTTTRISLQYARDIVQTYHQLGMPGIFLRPLTPLGFAKAEWERIGYSPDEWLAFYRQAFDEILKINKDGCCFPEQHAVYFLKKILHGYALNYMELRSPCGAALGQLAYYYDGNIYTCDEARMVAEAGNPAFRLGNVFDNSYQDIISSSTCKATCTASILEAVPGCCDCVYQPYCGICPVINYALEGDIFPKQLGGYRCRIYGGILDYLFDLIEKNDSDTLHILESWL